MGLVVGRLNCSTCNMGHGLYPKDPHIAAATPYNDGDIARCLVLSAEGQFLWLCPIAAIILAGAMDIVGISDPIVQNGKYNFIQTFRFKLTLPRKS